ncbi:MAG: 50S ribosomal protein L25 [Treponema sp.]|nr:50S ribosomal protein L25 [Treponema sp.]
MSQTLLTAVSRPTATKGQVRRLRAEGKLPAVIYDRHGKSRAILLDSAEFAKAVTGVSESTILKLSIDGKTTEAFIKDRQVNWLRGTLLHVDFFEVEQDQAIRAHVSIHLLGTPIGVREGGVLETPVHEVEVECLPKDLPSKIELDISNLGANHSIHVRDISLPNVRILNSGDQVVALVKFAKVETAPAAEEAAPAEGEAPAAPAAGAAPDAGAAPAKPEKKEKA